MVRLAAWYPMVLLNLYGAPPHGGICPPQTCEVNTMLTHKPKTIQIDFDFFEDLYIYAARHAEPDDLLYKRITMAVRKKLEALMKHELYSLYKAGASDEIRKKARDEYLDAAEIMESFRWSAEQDVNITRGEGVPSL